MEVNKHTNANSNRQDARHSQQRHILCSWSLLRRLSYRHFRHEVNHRLLQVGAVRLANALQLLPLRGHVCSTQHAHTGTVREVGVHHQHQ